MQPPLMTIVHRWWLDKSRATSLALALTLVVGATACTPDFDEAWKVTDLRILAIRATPPEVLTSIEAPFIPPVHLDALVVNPAAPEATYQWELWACSAENKDCSESRTQRFLAQGDSGLSEIQTDFVADLELIEGALAEDPLKGFGGVAVLVELRVRYDGLEARSSKRVVYGTFIPPQKTPNQNPALDHALANDEQITLPWSLADRSEIRLWPESSADSEEDYVVATFTGGSRDLTEFLTYSFYTTSGKLSNPNTGGKPSPFVTKKTVDDLTSTWTPAEEDQSATIWIVVRDDRGGVGWLTLPVALP